MHVIAVPWAEDFRWLSSGAILKTKVRSATGYLYNSPSIFLTDCPEDLCLFFLFRDLIQHFIKVKNCKREINSSCLWNKYQGQASMTELCLSFWQMYGIDDVIHIFKKKTTELRKSKLIYPRSHSYQEPSEWVKSLGPVRLFVTPWTAAHQAPPSMGFSRQGYRRGLPFPSPIKNQGKVQIHVSLILTVNILTPL